MHRAGGACPYMSRGLLLLNQPERVEPPRRKPTRTGRPTHDVCHVMTHDVCHFTALQNPAAIDWKNRAGGGGKEGLCQVHSRVSRKEKSPTHFCGIASVPAPKVHQ